MKKTKEVICEEQKFLRLCSETYKDMIHKKRNMPLEDFNIISSAILMLDLYDYYKYLTMYRFKDLYDKSTRYEEEELKELEMEIIFNDITPDEMDTAVDEENEHQRMLRKFWEQMPLESQKEKYRELFLPVKLCWTENGGK